MFGNLEDWLRGTFLGVSRKYLERHLEEFVNRFDRRWRETDMFGVALPRAACAEPLPDHRLVWLQPDRHGVDFLGWRLGEVTGISLDGKTLVGTGITPFGVGGSWLVHLDSIPDVPNVPVPEPGTVLLVMLGSLGLGLGCARRRP